MCDEVFPYEHLSNLKTLQAIKDWMLMIIVLVVVGIDLLIHAAGTAVPLSRINATLIPDEFNPKGVDVGNDRVQ